MLTSRQDWADLQPTITAAMIRQYAQQIGQSLRGELMLSTARNKYLLQRIEKTLEQLIATHRAIRQRNQFRPAFAELAFGGGGQLPPFSLKTPKGRQVRLHGKIDRVDVVQDQGLCAVLDYMLSGNTLSLERVYHGISLQLLTYLLVLQANGQTLVGRPLTPVAAFYLRLLRRLEEVAHPDEACAPEDPLFDLQVKPRGLFDARHIAAIDSALSDGPSDVVQAYIKKDGSFGHKNSSDVAETAEFSALLDHVRQRIGQLADDILAGNIAIAPYWIHRQTPCPACEYRCICRFDVLTNTYRSLPAMSREDVFQRVCSKPPGVTHGR